MAYLCDVAPDESACHDDVGFTVYIGDDGIAYSGDCAEFEDFTFADSVDIYVDGE